MPQHPFELPEIVEAVSRHLWRPDYLRCLTVSKIFYHVLRPRLYHSILLQSPHVSRRNECRYPSGGVLEGSKHHILEIKFFGRYPEEYLHLKGCTRLHTISFGPITENWGETSPEFKSLSALIAAHSDSLREVSIRLPINLIEANPCVCFWSALAQCQHLQMLRLKCLTVTKDCLSQFLEACARPKSLSLSCITISEGLEFPAKYNPADTDDNVNNTILTGPRELVLMGVPEEELFHVLCSRDQAILARSCVNLESLFWRGGRWRNGLEHIINHRQPLLDRETAHFAQTLCKTPWTLFKLHTLDLSYSLCQDTELAAILDKMSTLRSLKVTQTYFGPRSFAALIHSQASTLPAAADPRQRKCGLFQSIEVLWIDNCSLVTGDMIQTILEKCSSLKAFYADEIVVADIVAGHEWVCRDMQELGFCLMVSSSSPEDIDGLGDYCSSHIFKESQQIVYRRLAVLSNLTTLDLTYGMKDHSTVRRTLDLTLEAGLGQLKGLQELRMLSVRGDKFQTTGVEDLEWIAATWPRLKLLSSKVLR
ncbi:hypothetical protein BGZ98_005604 [Dissophora globulifera]|nr:hypothetical protein BGZ98_005604 [Dissophora globulifera]